MKLILFFLILIHKTISNTTQIYTFRGNNFLNKDISNVSYLFLHIHKTGGTTIMRQLRSLLKYEYWIETEHSYRIKYDRIVFPNQISPPLVFTFLRNPIDQVISAYQYEYEVESKHNKYIPNNTLHNINECMKTTSCIKFYANKQTREVGEENFDLETKFWFVGIFEYFDASLCMLRYKLGYFSERLCNCRCRYKMKDNIGIYDHHVSHQLNTTTISNATKQLIIQNIQKDMILYKLGLDYFKLETERLKNISGIDFLCDNNNDNNNDDSNTTTTKEYYNNNTSINISHQNHSNKIINMNMIQLDYCEINKRNLTYIKKKKSKPKPIIRNITINHLELQLNKYKKLIQDNNYSYYYYNYYLIIIILLLFSIIYYKRYIHKNDRRI